MYAIIHKLSSLPTLKMPAFLAFLIYLAAPSITQAVVFDVHQITDSAVNNANIDVAVDSHEISHAVYERSGSIYYVKGIGEEELVAAGSRPAIAVGPDSVPQVVYTSTGGQFYVTRAGEAWQAPMSISTYNGDIDIDVDSNNKAHITYVAQIDKTYPSDTSTGVDIGYINNRRHGTCSIFRATRGVAWNIRKPGRVKLSRVLLQQSPN